TCGKNMLFKKCGSNCRPTCADPDGSECSDEPCQEGCFCYSGMIYDGVGACIKPEQCGFPPVCGDGMEFKECASDCLPTCDDPEGTECSTTECVPKCTCKEGLVYNSANDTCV
ncbi:hypothetical protein CAPTEDRAFT_27427, partial [Capitella teleta]